MTKDNSFFFFFFDQLSTENTRLWKQYRLTTILSTYFLKQPLKLNVSQLLSGSPPTVCGSFRRIPSIFYHFRPPLYVSIAITEAICNIRCQLYLIIKKKKKREIHIFPHGFLDAKHAFSCEREERRVLLFLSDTKPRSSNTLQLNASQIAM